MNKSQKVVVVTGASQGIGAEIVKAFRKLDYRVVATSRTIRPSDDENILTVTGDIGDPATAQRILSETIARYGRVDTLVNNAGIFIGKPFTENTIDDFNAAMHVNLARFFHITRLVLAEMQRQENGHVVTVTASIDNGVSGGRTSLARHMTRAPTRHDRCRTCQA
jgi:NAD(P)-dependent dehydrogenase (short-subunit alcohol dehydrogenase family)